MDGWLPSDTIRRMGFGQVIAARRHTLIVERGVSFAAFDENGTATQTVYASNIYAAQARYLIDLRNDYVFGCLVVDDRAFSRLPVAHQAAVRDAASHLGERYADLGRRVDDALLGGLFQKQGLTPLPVSDSFRAETSTRLSSEPTVSL